MNGGPSGFQNAPVTRFFLVLCALLTVIFAARGRSASLGLSFQDVTTGFHLWRIIASIFAFSTVPELVFGSYLLYYFRIFERQISSNKHSVFILFSLSASLFFEVLSLALLKDRTSRMLASGPYGIIFASFIPFYCDIPVSSKFRVFGMPLSDKTFIYLAGFQLLFSSWTRTLIPGVCGLLAGSLYRLNMFGIRRFKFPQFIVSLFSWLSWSNSGSSPSRRVNLRRNVRAYGGHQRENFSSQPLQSLSHLNLL
ncbi:hypothetical protein AXF42_Ash012223 [Apostasia shenzhenica]|uniref:Peptidase S54 rhomboid domain-containing protein n=1 Tax=Apostasia shenzhenica TaxID=1088818 RepID=A0A2I0B4B2_9ASPA|nr:hypothetical protein AXF42_Ash012223 [Apostasia shenzhenica]